MCQHGLTLTRTVLIEIPGGAQYAGHVKRYGLWNRCFVAFHHFFLRLGMSVSSFFQLGSLPGESGLGLGEPRGAVRGTAHAKQATD